MRGVTRLLAGLCLIALGACSHQYTPSPDRPFEAITEFTSTQAVALRNGQQAKLEVAFFNQRNSVWYGDLREWTDVAIAIAGRELGKRGMRVTPGAGKWLRLTVTSAVTEAELATVGTKVQMRVETSEGYATTYTGHNSAGFMANLPRQVDGAMMRVVVEMLRDPAIVRFLQQE